MSDQEESAAELDTLHTHFITWHDSAGNVHLRTDSYVLFIDKKNDALLAKAKALSRHQPITVTGRMNYSKTLSTHVFEVESLEAA